MKCQILFSGKTKINISKCCLLKILPSIQSVKVHVVIMSPPDRGGDILFLPQLSVSPSCNRSAL